MAQTRVVASPVYQTLDKTSICIALFIFNDGVIGQDSDWFIASVIKFILFSHHITVGMFEDVNSSI